VTLEELRQQIDEIDGQVLELLNRRAQCAKAIGEIKHSTNAVYYVPEREKIVFDNLCERNRGPLPNEAVQAIYREIISSARALEKRVTVAFLGPYHTFSHIAALRVFGATAEYHPLASLPDIFTEVEHARVDYGVVPVESSMGGGVSDTLDRFMTSDLKIINEIMLHITQYLLSNSPLDKITRVYSKDQSFFQCREWLRANLPNVELIETASTAEAARVASLEPEGAAAIASRLAAESHSLNVVAERIEDAAHNYTRFFVIGRQAPGRTGKDKTAVLLSAKDRPGALCSLLSPFSEEGVNLTRIESRPSRKKAWEYVFFIDMFGHIEDESVKRALERVSEHCVELRILGSFPRGGVET